MDRMDADQSFPRADLARTPFKIGGVSLPSRYLLAPLAGYTNLALRLAVAKWAASGWQPPISSILAP